MVGYSISRLMSSRMYTLLPTQQLPLRPSAPFPALPGILLSGNQHALLFEQRAQLPVLMHAHQDVAASHELLVHVQLRYRGPVGILLDTCTRSRSAPFERLITITAKQQETPYPL